MTNQYSITPLNETAALVSFGNVIDIEINKKVMMLHQLLSEAPFEGFIESVPAYSSLAVFYQRPASFSFVKELLQKLLELSPSAQVNGSVIQIPVLYDGDDLEYVAQQRSLIRDEVVTIHTSGVYRVFMLGFLPGFAYMGTVDDRIATPRKNSPRTLVPAGSVGIAGIQTGVYPQASPGGWQLIGRTPLKMFDVKKNFPCLLKPGDEVKFYSISESEFEKLNEY